MNKLRVFRSGTAAAIRAQLPTAYHDHYVPIDINRKQMYDTKCWYTASVSRLSNWSFSSFKEFKDVSLYLQMAWTWGCCLHLHKLGAKLSNWHQRDHTYAVPGTGTGTQDMQESLAVVES